VQRQCRQGKAGSVNVGNLGACACYMCSGSVAADAMPARLVKSMYVDRVNTPVHATLSEYIHTHAGQAPW
jgi:hypothetical protein